MTRVFAVLLVLLATFSSSLAQTQKTRSALTTEINTNFADNTSGAITPAIARTTYLDFLASWQVIAATSVANADYPMTASDRYVYTTTAALAAVRTITLPAASAVNKGEIVSVSDAGAAINGANVLLVARNGADTIATLTTPYGLYSAGAGVVFQSDGVSNWGIVGSAGSTGFSAKVVTQSFGGRLTLATHTPVMTSTVGSTGVVYYDCAVSNAVTFFDGTADIAVPIPSCEVSTTMQTSGTGVTNSGDMFDVWWSGTNSNICVATNGSGGGWSSDTGSTISRGTGYSAIDRTTRPYPTNKNALTHCYNGTSDYGTIAVNQATYLGSLFTTGAGRTQYTFGTAASGGGQAQLLLWNMYNRINVSTTVTDSGVSYTYSSATIREARGSATNQANFVLGLAEDAVAASLTTRNQSAAVAASFGYTGLGLDLTNAFVGASFLCYSITTTANICSGGISTASYGLIGQHFYALLEQGDGTNNTTFDAGTNAQLTIQIKM